MKADYSSLELDALSRNQSNADTDALKDEPIQAFQCQIQEFLIGSDIKNARDRQIGPDVETVSRLNRRRRSRKWRSIINHCSAFCLVSGLVVALVAVSVLGLSFGYSAASSGILGFGFCEPDGTFNVGLDALSIWSPSNAFQITLGFGSMSFPEAKLIDIIWDVVIGRGIQGILGFTMYRAFSKSLSRIMERSPVSFDTFEAVALQDSSVRALVGLIKDYFTNRGTRTKLAASWMILAMSYVLMFPTLMSAMTGYSATSNPYIRAPDGSQVEWSSFRLVNYIIYDGWRVGLTGSYLVNAVSGGGMADPSQDFNANICALIDPYDEDFDLQGSEQENKHCLLTMAVSQYAETYGFYGTNQTTSTFSPDNSTIFNLTSPTLNISAFYIYPGSTIFGSDGLFSSGSAATQPFTNASLARFARIDKPDNQTYDIPYIKANGLCQQQNTYQWGFSFLLLFIALLLSALWALGLWAMWLDAYWNSKIDAARERDMGSWRAAMDLAEGISASLDGRISCGQDTIGDVLGQTKNLGDSEIRRRVRQESGHGWIGYMNLIGPDKVIMTRSTRLRKWLGMRAWGRWLLRWRGWVIAGVVLAIFLLTVVYPLAASGVI